MTLTLTIALILATVAAAVAIVQAVLLDAQVKEVVAERDDAQIEAALHKAAADHFRGKYRDEVKVNGIFLSLFGGETPIALDAGARSAARNLPVSIAAPLAAEPWLAAEAERFPDDFAAWLDVQEMWGEEG